MNTDCKIVARAVLLSAEGTETRGRVFEKSCRHDALELAASISESSSENDENQIEHDDDLWIIEWAQKMRTAALSSAATAGGRVVDGTPAPGMATVYIGEKYFYI